MEKKDMLHDEENKDIDNENIDTDTLDDIDTSYDDTLDEYDDLDDIDKEQRTEMKSQYEAKIADLQARLDKSERAHQAKKQKAKAQKEHGGTQTDSMDEGSIEARIEAKIEFYASNPEAKALKDEIEGYTAKGIPRDKAFRLAQMETSDAQKVAEPKTAGRTRNTQDGFALLSHGDYQKLSTSRKNQYMKSCIKKFDELRFS